jgi:hypothetical protein
MRVAYINELPASFKNPTMKNNFDIFDSVKSEAIKELSAEILETTFDLMTDSEVLKEIPIFGFGFKTYALYQTLTESFFAKKLMSFLFELKFN